MSLRMSGPLIAVCAAVLILSVPGCPKRCDPNEEDVVPKTSEARSPKVEPLPFERDLRSPFDGEGRATVDPDSPVGAGTLGTWTVTFSVGEHGIETGGGVSISVSGFWGWTPPQTTSPEYSGYSTLVAKPANAKLAFEAIEMTLYIRVEEGRLTEGESIAVTYGDSSNGKHPQARGRCDKFAESEEEFHVRVDQDGDGFYASLPFGEQPTIEILGREPARLTLLGPSMAAVGETVRFDLAVLDVLDNRSSRFCGAVELTLPDSVGGGPSEPLVFTEEDRGAKSVELTFERVGLYTVKASRPEAPGFETESNPVLVMDELPGLQLFWGDLQGHGGLCDGSGTPDDYYLYGRDVARLDICCLTTHDAWGLYLMDEHPEVFETARAAAEFYNDPGSFLTFVGYEYTNWTTGHKHVIFPGAEGRVVSYRMEEGKTPDRLWNSLRETGALTISHHPGGGPIVEDWSYADAEMETVVEMVSVHGSSEYYGCPQMIHRPVKGGFAQDALARGLRLGFIGSGDTHNGHPGMGDRQSPTGGLAAVYAKELSRAAVFRAIKERRVYATSGARIILTFSVEERNGKGKTVMMGGELRLENASAPRAIRAMAIGETDIVSLELVKNNETVARKPGSGREVSLDLIDEEPLDGGAFYYIRVEQKDGHRAWSSPVWVDAK